MNAGFSSMVALTIAVGIGSTLTTFSAVDRLLLRGPELVDQPERVARIYLTRARARTPRANIEHGWIRGVHRVSRCAHFRRRRGLR